MSEEAKAEDVNAKKAKEELLAKGYEESYIDRGIKITKKNGMFRKDQKYNNHENLIIFIISVIERLKKKDARKDAYKAMSEEVKAEDVNAKNAKEELLAKGYEESYIDRGIKITKKNGMECNDHDFIISVILSLKKKDAYKEKKAVTKEREKLYVIDKQYSKVEGNYANDTYLNNFDEKDIEDMLDEIHAPKQYQPLPTNKKKRWKRLYRALRESDLNYIKWVVTNVDEKGESFDVNERDRKDMTLLIHCALMGQYSIAEFLCESGADINARFGHNYVREARARIGHDAIIKAKEKGNYHIQTLLTLKKMGASMGSSVQATVDNMNKMRGIADYALNEYKMSDEYLNQTIYFLQQAISDCAPFSTDILYVVWIKITQTMRENSLSHPLFVTIIKCFENIISNTKNKVGFAWLNEFILPSKIWLLSHPNMKDKLLFYELLYRIQNETKIKSELWLKKDIDSIPQKIWNDIVSFGDQKFMKTDTRQIVALKPTKNDLLIERQAHSAFDPVTHYDKNIFLGQLFLRANRIDTIFQNEMSKITRLICAKMKINNTAYRAGPLKKVKRAKEKIDSDYFNCSFPTAAKLLDINRCAIKFCDAKDMMLFLNEFISFIAENGNKLCIKQVMRIKNGFAEMGSDRTKITDYTYKDIKLNVRVHDIYGHDILTEIQFMLDFIMNYKTKISHALYSIEREKEFVDNFNNIKHDLLSKEKQLFAMASKGDIKGLIKYLVRNNANVNDLFIKNEKYQTILKPLCKYNWKTALHKLIKLCVAEMGNDNLIKELLIDPDTTNYHESPIQDALKNNCVDILQFICEKYPKLIIFFKSYDGRIGHMNQSKCDIKEVENVLHFIARTNNIDIAQWIINSATKIHLQDLIQQKTNHDTVCSHTSKSKTPFIIACMKGHQVLVEMFLNVFDDDNQRIQLFKICDDAGDTALSWAAYANKIKCVESIINVLNRVNKNVKLNVLNHKNKKGQTALDEAKTDEMKSILQMHMR